MLHQPCLVYTPGDRNALVLLLFLNQVRRYIRVKLLDQDILVALPSWIQFLLEKKP